MAEIGILIGLLQARPAQAATLLRRLFADKRQRLVLWSRTGSPRLVRPPSAAAPGKRPNIVYPGAPRARFRKHPRAGFFFLRRRPTL